MKRGGGLRRTGGLKPGKPLVAKTELVRYTPLRANTGLNPGRGLRAAPFRPQRPKPPTDEKRTAKDMLAARCGGYCEGCGRYGQLDPSHRVRQSQGGPWHVSNLLALCRPDHDWLHDNETEARERLGWCLKSHQDFLTLPAWIFGREWCLLTADGGLTPITEIPDEENTA